MQIVRNIASKVVVYTFADSVPLSFTRFGLQTPDFNALDIKPSTFEIVQGVPALPSNIQFVGNALTFDGTSWAIADQTAYNSFIANQTALDKTLTLAKLDSLRDSKLTSTFTFQGSTNPAISSFPMGSSATSQASWQSLGIICLNLIAAGQGTTVVSLYPDDGVPGSVVSLPATSMLIVLNAYAARQQTIWTYYNSLASTLNAATTEAALTAVNLTDGWPA